MEYAYEGDRLTGEGRQSYFTAALLEALETGKADRDQDMLISVDELYEYIFARVRELTPNQTPTKQISLEGALYVAHSSYIAPVVAAELDESLVQLAENPVAAARLAAVEELQRLLTSRSPGVALAARQFLADMVNDDSIKVRNAVTIALGNSTPRNEHAATPEGQLTGRPDDPSGSEAADEESTLPSAPKTTSEPSTRPTPRIAETDLTPTHAVTRRRQLVGREKFDRATRWGLALWRSPRGRVASLATLLVIAGVIVAVVILTGGPPTPNPHRRCTALPGKPCVYFANPSANDAAVNSRTGPENWGTITIPNNSSISWRCTDSNSLGVQGYSTGAADNLDFQPAAKSGRAAVAAGTFTNLLIQAAPGSCTVSIGP